MEIRFRIFLFGIFMDFWSLRFHITCLANLKARDQPLELSSASFPLHALCPQEFDAAYAACNYCPSVCAAERWLSRSMPAMADVPKHRWVWENWKCTTTVSGDPTRQQIFLPTDMWVDMLHWCFRVPFNSSVQQPRRFEASVLRCADANLMQLASSSIEFHVWFISLFQCWQQSLCRAEDVRPDGPTVCNLSGPIPDGTWRWTS